MLLLFGDLTVIRFQEYVITPAKELSSEEISLSVSVGLWGGVFPVPAVTTFITLVLVGILQLSVTQKALALTFNMLATPLQILNMPTFILLGSSFFNMSNCEPLTLLSTFKDPNVGFFSTLMNSSACLSAGVVAWAVLGVPMVYLATTIVTYLLKQRSRKTS